jgi:hypothetical protein
MEPARMNRAHIALFLALAWLALPAQAQSNAAPTAVLSAPHTIPYSSPLTLSGAGSVDPDGTVLRYVWTKLTGDGGGMPLNASFGTLEPTYLVPQPAGHPLALGRHRFRLVVDDNSGNHSNPTELEVLVIDNTAPTAVLDAPDSIGFGAPLELSGARSTDVLGRIAQYAWTHIEGGGSNFVLNQPVVTDASSVVVSQPAGNALALGRHRFRLIVSDDSGNVSQPTERVVMVTDTTAPTAVLDAERQVTQIQPFQLSAARSFDVGGKVKQFQWTRIAGTPDGPMPLGKPVVTTTNALVVAQSPTSYLGIGRHVFRLLVADDSGNASKPTDVAVDIVAPLPAGRSQ